MKFSSLLLFFLSINTLAQQPMSPEKLWQLERLGEYILSEDEKSVFYTATVYNVDSNKGASYIAAVPADGGPATVLFDMQGSEYNLCHIPNARRLFFMNGGKAYHCAYDGTDILPFQGLEDAENVRFSKDGKKVVFSRGVKVFSATSDRHPDLPKADVLLYDDLMFRHWNQWTDDKVNHVFYAGVENFSLADNPTDIMADQPWDCPLMPFGGAEDFVWGPDAQTILYVCKKSNGVDYARSTNSDIFQYDLPTGQTANLTAFNTGYDKSPKLSADGKHLLWLSMSRDGYESDRNRLFVRNMNTGENREILPELDETLQAAVWAADGKSIIAVQPNDGTQQLIKISFDPSRSSTKGTITALTWGDYNYQLPVVGKNLLIAARTDMNHAAELYRIAQGKKSALSKLTYLNDKHYAGIKTSKVERRYVETTDGKKMLVWLIYPPDFDASKKYPALLYCQGGPQSQVSQFYSFRWNFQLMAARGYVVIAPNRRGLPGFGTAWNETISKDWGGQAMRDYLSATDALKKESFIDAGRIGAIGASYGGYSVYYLAGIHQKRFKTFVAHCGLYNLESWYGSTEELFFADWDIGGPYFAGTIPESYLKFSPHRFAKNWDTPIMVIHGGRDFRVPDTQGMEAFTAARVKGIKSRFLYFPSEGHWVLKPQNGVVWHTEFFRWLQETL
jgi:dipeptidyl aminopeptidase/acylaminoacyl peptidase